MVNRLGKLLDSLMHIYISNNKRKVKERVNSISIGYSKKRNICVFLDKIVKSIEALRTGQHKQVVQLFLVEKIVKRTVLFMFVTERFYNKGQRYLQY